ncbi:MAG: hypothetical protein KGL10_01100 [Alphaproteobacteria bacterium]|nr:hypothetical protein [Alphaproteobacteria bacterium]
MSPSVKALNLYRNVRGRWSLMLFFFRWDKDYRKDLITTILAFTILVYEIWSWMTIYDIIAAALDASIIAVQLGGDMTVIPADYRPSHGGIPYTAANSTYISYHELSVPMSEVLPAPVENALGFCNPVSAVKTCKESPLVSDRVDDALMLRDSIPWREDNTPLNFVFSRHQLRYIAIRVLNKLQHTTNGMLMAFQDTADALVDASRPVTLRKAWYYDGLLTLEAFRSRIFRGNLQHETEVYTDLTTYFPVNRETTGGKDFLRFRPDFLTRVSMHTGITSLLLTENRRVALLYQGSTKAVGANMVCLGGSGSLEYKDMKRAGTPKNFRDLLVYAMAREVCEETGMEKYLDEVRANTMVTGFFRWIDRCGLPEFVGLTRAGNVPFAKQRTIDGDEVIRFEEVPVTVNRPEDFHAVLAYIRTHEIRTALSSFMALNRMTVIAGYGAESATPEQKEIYRRVSNFIAGS